MPVGKGWRSGDGAGVLAGQTGASPASGCARQETAGGEYAGAEPADGPRRLRPGHVPLVRPFAPGPAQDLRLHAVPRHERLRDLRRGSVGRGVAAPEGPRRQFLARAEHVGRVGRVGVQRVGAVGLF